MPTPDPYWTDGRGCRLLPKPCRKCGANVGSMPLRLENLHRLGWQPYTVQSFQSWYGHRQESARSPREDGSVPGSVAHCNRCSHSGDRVPPLGARLAGGHARLTDCLRPSDIPNSRIWVHE